MEIILSGLLINDQKVFNRAFLCWKRPFKILFSFSDVVDVDVGGNKIGNIEETAGMQSEHEGGMFIKIYIQMMDIFV